MYIREDAFVFFAKNKEKPMSVFGRDKSKKIDREKRLLSVFGSQNPDYE